jgi:hypothetical protein
MIAILHSGRSEGAAPKMVNGLKVLFLVLERSRQYFSTPAPIVKPGEIHCSNRAWTRNSAFIMAQYEMAQSKQNHG